MLPGRIQHDAVPGIEDLRLGDRFAVDAAKLPKSSSSASISVSKVRKREVNADPRSQILSEPGRRYVRSCDVRS